MTEITKLVTHFHNIQGDTLMERQKHFNEFLKTLKFTITNEDDLNNFIQLITPTTVTEEVFKITLMIKFRRNKLLLEKLKTGDPVFIAKLLKDWRQFGELFGDITANDLVNNILPHFSYSLRLKLLNGISKNVGNEVKLDEYFLAIHKKYGLKSAGIILPGCSLELIKSKVKQYHFKLPESHLKKIFKRDKEFVDTYFAIMKEKYEDIKLADEYPNVLKYVAMIDPHIYWNLEKKYEFKSRVKFGKYMTPKMVKSHKNISNEGFEAFEKFHCLKMFKTIKKEDKLNEFLQNLYPETHDNFTTVVLTEKILKFLQKGPRLQQYTLINSSFRQKYNRDLVDYPDYFTEDLLKITPLKERENILDHKVKEDENLYYLYGTASSIPKFKQHLQHSSKGMRQEYAKALLETCFANSNKDSLLEVLNFLCNRYKNDVDVWRIIFDKCIGKIDIARRYFNAEHWECLVNMLKIFHLKCHYWGEAQFYENYILYLITNGKSIDEVVKDMVKALAEGKSYGYVCIKNRRYHKMYCDKIASCIDTYRKHDRYKSMVHQFLHMTTRECRLKKEELLEYKRFFDQLDGSEWTSQRFIISAVKLNDEDIHNLFWNSESEYIKDNGALVWYAKNRPDKLNENVDKIAKKCGEHKHGKFLQRLKRYIDENLTEAIKAHTLSIIKDENLEDVQVSITILAALTPETFMELIPSSLPPEDGKIDLEESTDKIKVQRAFVNSLRYTQNPSQAFPWVLKFCIGDYLKFALPSLYGLASNTKELSLEEYLKGLSYAAMSVKKHFLYLARQLFPFDDFYNILRIWSEKEKNLSMRNILLKKTVEYLIENPSQDLWNMFKTNLQLLDPEDRGIYDFLLKFQRIPLEYMPEYIELVYNVIAVHPDAKVKEKRFQLASAIPLRLVPRFNFEFLKQLTTEIACSNDACIFHWRCVFVMDGMKQLELFQQNFDKLKNYTQDNGIALQQEPSIRCCISNFVLHFVQSAIKSKSGGELIGRFMTHWAAIFQPENFNKDFMLVEFTSLLFKCDFDPYQTGINTSKLLYDYIHKYNSSIIDSFCHRLRYFLSMTPFENGENDTFKFVDGFFYEKRDENIYIAVIYFLPKILPTYENAYAKYTPIWEAVQTCKSPAVRYYFDLYLCSGEL